MPSRPVHLRMLVLAAIALAATRAGAVDITGSWAICLSQTDDPFCPPTLDATLVGTTTQFTMVFASLPCGTVTGTVDPGTGAMTGTGGNCLGGNGALSGTATDTSMSGTVYLDDGICAFEYAGVRPCPACDDGFACTTDGCGATACSAPGSSCTTAVAPPNTPCSDGNLCTNGDHCSGATCTGSPINCNDNEVCTDEHCDPGTGACVFVPNSNPCNDHNACTTNDTCSGGHCVGGPPPQCGPCQRCGPFVGCVVGPKAGCRTPLDPTKSQLTLRNDADDTHDQLLWKWSKGQATTPADLGDPTTTDDYTLCVYDHTDATPRLLLQSSAPAASTCPFGPTGVACWRALGNPAGSKGFLYRNAGLFSPDGLARVKLGPGAEGKAKMSVKGQGPNLAMPSPLDVTLPVRVQLRAESGACWEASYDSAVIDREDLFRAKGN